MTKEDILISVLQDEDIVSVNNFYNSTYNENRSLEVFMWEFFHAPAGKALYVIARDRNTGQIVGTQCAIPINLVTFDGRVVRSAKSEDTLVDPNYRGLNIFERMYDLLFEKCIADGILYIWGFTAAKKPFLKVGFTIPFDHSQSLLVFGVAGSYRYLSKLNRTNSMLDKAKIAGLCLAAKCLSLKRLFRAKTFSDQDVSLSILDKSSVLDNHSLISVDSEDGFQIMEDLAFLKWRITQNPYFTRICNIYVSIAGVTVANVLFNLHKDHVWYLIHDTYATTISDAQKVIVLNKAIQALHKSEGGKIQLLRTWDFVHNTLGMREISLRKQLGFVHLNRGISFVWKSLDPENALDVASFHLSRIASQGMI
jgi:hypothetical protein